MDTADTDVERQPHMLTHIYFQFQQRCCHLETVEVFHFGDAHCLILCLVCSGVLVAKNWNEHRHRCQRENPRIVVVLERLECRHSNRSKVRGRQQQTGGWTWAEDKIRHEMKGRRQTGEEQLQTDKGRCGLKKGGTENKDNLEKKRSSLLPRYLKRKKQVREVNSSASSCKCPANATGEGFSTLLPPTQAWASSLLLQAVCVCQIWHRLLTPRKLFNKRQIYHPFNHLSSFLRQTPRRPEIHVFMSERVIISKCSIYYWLNLVHQSGVRLH